MTESATPKSTSFRCVACGASTAFDPHAGAIKCSHCGHVQAVAASTKPILEHDFASTLASMPTMNAAALVDAGHEIECRQCGARVVTAAQATRCPYCDSPVVVRVESESANVLTPESLLPFSVSRDAALTLFRSWLTSLWFAPNDLKKRARTEVIDGVYVPYYTYDAETFSSYSGERGDDYWVTETYRDSDGKTKTRRVKRTRWSHVSGNVDVSFDDLLVCASSRLPQKLVNALEPWDLAGLTAYQSAFLAGFSAERYSVDPQTGLEHAKERMLPTIREAVRRDIGGDQQRIASLDVVHRDVKFKHLLLPLWISAFRYNTKAFRFFVNARTGLVSGERPWSVAKIAFAVLAGLAVITAIIALALR